MRSSLPPLPFPFPFPFPLPLPFHAATWMVTVPGPVRFAPFVTVIQENDVVAVQVQPAAVVTVTVTVPPSSSKFREFGLIEYEQPLACVTVKTLLAIVSVPVRAGPLLVATLNLTVPLPVPLAPDVMVTHGAELTAVQAHPAGIVTETLFPELLSAGPECAVGLIVAEQTGAGGGLVGGAGAGLAGGAGLVGGVGAGLAGGAGLVGGVGAGLAGGAGLVGGVGAGPGGGLGGGPGTLGGGVGGGFGGSVACDSVTVWPATVSTPVRPGPLFGSMPKVTSPESRPGCATANGDPAHAARGGPGTAVLGRDVQTPRAALRRQRLRGQFNREPARRTFLTERDTLVVQQNVPLTPRLGRVGRELKTHLAIPSARRRREVRDPDGLCRRGPRALRLSSNRD